MRATLALALLVAACGGGGGGVDDTGDDGGDVDPVLIPGGGVTSGSIDGEVNVHVVEVGTATPIPQASVRVGALEALTNAEGLAVISDPSLVGPQTVTATATGHAAATWIGVAGANVTIPLEPPQRNAPTAHVTGTIAGWDGLPDPAFGNYRLAVVLYSFVDDVNHPDNKIAQPMSGGAPLNTCLKSALSDNCSWQLNARVGRQVHFATIVEGDPNGTTSDPSDDTYELIGYAIGEPMTLTAGQQMNGESLTVISAGERTGMTVTFPPAAGGLTDVVAIPMLDLGDDGRLVFPLPTLRPGNASTQVLAPTGRFAGSYELVALATPPGAATQPYSSSFVHAASPGAVTIDAWLGAPSQVAATSGTYSFTPAAGAQVNYATFVRGGATLWSVTLLDATTSFQLPALTPDPLGNGQVELQITAADVAGFDPTDFTVPDVTAALARAAGASATFTH